MKEFFSMREAETFLQKWQKHLRLQGWDIRIHEVTTIWRKTGDIKIDQDDRKAILMINNCNPKQTNLEALIIHELLHLKLWGMDQMIEELIGVGFGHDESDPAYQYAYRRFMGVLEPTVEDLAKAFYLMENHDGEISFGRVQQQVDAELDS